MRVKQEHIFSVNPNENGFSLVELLVAIAIFGLVIGSVYSSFGSQNKIYHAQEKVAAIQQNIRAAMYVMERDIRMTGYDPERAGTFGVEACGPSAITFTQQDDRPGQPLGAIIRTTFALNGTNLERTVAGGPNPTGADVTLAQNIQAFGLAYAYDSNGDGNLETDGNGNIIWATDSDGNNSLDMPLLDSNGDGVFDQADDTNSDNLIDVGTAINIPATNIRAIRIWVLGQSDPAMPDSGHSDTNTYVIGRTIVNSPNDGLYRRMLTSIVKCRNMGVQ